MLERELIKLLKPTKEPPVIEITQQVAQKVEAIWVRASLPTISHKRVLEKIKLLHTKYQVVRKPYKGRKVQRHYHNKIQQFAAEARGQLIDISTCKCNDYSTCKCDKDKKIPVDERTFLTDQRSVRRMMIGCVDLNRTKQIRKRTKRKQRGSCCSSKTVAEQSDRDEDNCGDDVSEDSERKESSSEDDFQQPPTKLVKQQQMRLNLVNFARECDSL